MARICDIAPPPRSGFQTLLNNPRRAVERRRNRGKDGGPGPCGSGVAVEQGKVVRAGSQGGADGPGAHQGGADGPGAHQGGADGPGAHQGGADGPGAPQGGADGNGAHQGGAAGPGAH